MAVQSGLAPLGKSEFRQFQEMILAEAGIHLNESKQVLVESRLSRRLRSLGMESYGAYLDFLTAQPRGSPERQEMINCITTNKTDFFRENHHFEFLRERVIPEARARAARGGPKRLRVWSAACSTGEEPYSIAVTLLDAFGEDRGWDIKILASDIDTQVLATAEAGLYEPHRQEGLPENFRRRYFLRRKEDGALLARDELKNLIRFRRINFIDAAWPIQTTFDAIFCRNVIIYFNRATQQTLFTKLAKFLLPTGYLMVGHSENLHWLNTLLTPVQNTVYRLRTAGTP